jgi:hypothetical protein
MTAHPVLLFAFTLANVVIATGYVYLALTVMRRINLKHAVTRIAGICFFLFCGLTHFDMAYNAIVNSNMAFGMMDTSWYMLTIHIPQAVCVLVFAAGLYVEVDTWNTGNYIRPSPNTTEKDDAEPKHDSDTGAP